MSTDARPIGMQPDGLGRPLIASRAGIRSTGLQTLALGVALCVTSALVESRSGLFSELVFAPFLTVPQSWFMIRTTRRSIGRATPVPDSARRTAVPAFARAIRSLAMSTAVSVFLAIAYDRWLYSPSNRHGFAFTGALQLLFGTSELVAARWLGRWEREHGQTLLHELRRFSFRAPPTYLTIPDS